jgi:hypothetical protein
VGRCWRFDRRSAFAPTRTAPTLTRFPTLKAVTYSLTECHVMMISPSEPLPYIYQRMEPRLRDHGVMVTTHLTKYRLNLAPSCNVPVGTGRNKFPSLSAGS